MPQFRPVVTPAKTWNEFKRERMESVFKCEVLGCHRSPVHAHHVFLRRDRRKQYKKWVDQIENMQLVCDKCHLDGTADGRYNQEWFMTLQKTRYNMTKWWSTIPHKKRLTNKDIGGMV